MVLNPGGFIRGFLLTLLMFGAVRALSQDFSLRTPMDELKSSSPFQSSVDIYFESFTSANRPIYSQDAYHQNLNLEWSPKAEKKRQRFGYKVDSGFLFSVGEEWGYAHIRDLYFNYSDVKVGFVKHEWNAFEQEWRLGLFEPRFLDNRLTGGHGSLAGFHWQSNRFTLSVMPVFVPELGPRHKLEDGNFISKNPWFSLPPSSLRYRDEVAPVRFALDTPPIEEIVLKPGAAISYDHQNQNYRSRYSAAYKPVPQVILNFPADRRFIVGSSDAYFFAEVKPTIAYHTLLSTDQIFELSQINSRVRVSLAHEIPQIDSRPSDWVTQEFGPATFLSSRFDHHLPNLSSTVYASTLYVWGGDEPDQGRYAGEETFFERRHSFVNAYALGVLASWPTQRPFESDLRVTYDVDQNAGALVIQNRYRVSRPLAISLNAEWLGVINEGQKIKDGFLSTYRGNDRLELGVSYVY